MNKAIYASKLSDTDNVCSFYNAGIANMLERETTQAQIENEQVADKIEKIHSESPDKGA